MRNFVFVLYVCLLTPFFAHGQVDVGLSDTEQEVVLKDGTSVIAVVRTEGSIQWLEPANHPGFYITSDEDGQWVLVHEDYKDVIAINPPTDDFQWGSAAVEEENVVYSPVGPSGFDQNLLVIRVAFPDESLLYSVEEVERLVFSAEKSVRHYFSENSSGLFRVVPAEENDRDNNGIVDVTLNRLHPNFGSNFGTVTHNLVKEALLAANQYVDFNKFDRNSNRFLEVTELSVILLVAGYEKAYGGVFTPSPNIWAHQSSVSNIILDGVSMKKYAMFGERHKGHLATMGIISHELGHLFFNLPDIYGKKGESNGVGRWGLMGYGTWNARSGQPLGSSPAHMLAWSKQKVNFVTPKEPVFHSESIHLKASNLGGEVMKFWLDPYKHSEYLLLEYRNQSGFDQGLPGSGLLVSRVNNWIDHRQTKLVNKYQIIDIIEPNGRTDLSTAVNRGDDRDVYGNADNSNSFRLAVENGIQVDVDNIDVSDQVSAQVSLHEIPSGETVQYDKHVSTVRVNNISSTLLRMTMPEDKSWIHGVDLYADYSVSVELQIYKTFQSGQVLDPMNEKTNRQQLNPGWNRIMFDQTIAVESGSSVYIRTHFFDGAYDAISVDNVGELSRRSYAWANDRYVLQYYNVNQRVLVANQISSYASSVSDFVALSDDSNQSIQKSSASGGGFRLWVLLALLVLLGRKISQIKKSHV